MSSADLAKRLGVRVLGSTSRKVEAGLSSGSLALNLALTGHPLRAYVSGVIYELSGNEGAGKSTLAMHAAAECQLAKGEALYLDMEHALDPVYARAIGVDIDNLLFEQPDTAEECLELLQKSVKDVRLIIVDSVAAMSPAAEHQSEIGESPMGLQARVMSIALRKLSSQIGKSPASVIFINQFRSQIGGYGASDTTAGGKALRYYSGVRSEVRSPRSSKILDGTVEIGFHANYKSIKNKLFPPYRSCTIPIHYGKGIYRDGDLLNCAKELGVVTDLSVSYKSFTYKSKKRTSGSLTDDLKKQILADCLKNAGNAAIIKSAAESAQTDD